MARIAINGLGRMGKLVLRAFFEHGLPGEIILLNDRAGTPEQHAQFLEFDSVHGRWRADFAYDEAGIAINGARMRLACSDRIENLPLHDLGVDLVVDCTGTFKSPALVQPYYDAGVEKVVVSAPVKEEPALNIVYGVNHDRYDPTVHHLLTAASCTTNCLAPVVRVLQEEIGIKHGSITTVHDVTNTQTLVDRPARNTRRARSALNSLIPTTTGSATAITLIYPELKGRLNGHAIRVPLLNASLTDCVFEMQRPVTAAEVNGLFQTWSEGKLRGLLGYESRELVSADFVNDPRSAVIDGPSTMVINGTQLKVYAWYDNEWGYACRLADVTRMVAASLDRRHV
ncbi:MAG TPA: ArsJ-associated glyceraldehyde-3-phosphate dehydrogenase [Alphaproteobacteria bacterium]|nr:ArsJ-associated glyceraldehyde-3-phosphate dehydrogenase [Alphaproteobacteria bacterium]